MEKCVLHLTRLRVASRVPDVAAHAIRALQRHGVSDRGPATKKCHRPRLRERQKTKRGQRRGADRGLRDVEAIERWKRRQQL
jgi:hypothetical protein